MSLIRLHIYIGTFEKHLVSAQEEDGGESSKISSISSPDLIISGRAKNEFRRVSLDLPDVLSEFRNIAFLKVRKLL